MAFANLSSHGAISVALCNTPALWIDRITQPEWSHLPPTHVWEGECDSGDGGREETERTRTSNDCFTIKVNPPSFFLIIRRGLPFKVRAAPTHTHTIECVLVHYTACWVGLCHCCAGGLCAFALDEIRSGGQQQLLTRSAGTLEGWHRYNTQQEIQCEVPSHSSLVKGVALGEFIPGYSRA